MNKKLTLDKQNLKEIELALQQVDKLYNELSESTSHKIFNYCKVYSPKYYIKEILRLISKILKDDKFWE